MIVETSASGSVSDDEGGIMEFIPDDSDDILKFCAGECGQKILYFDVKLDQDSWDNGMDGAFCLECRARMIISGSLK